MPINSNKKRKVENKVEDYVPHVINSGSTANIPNGVTHVQFDSNVREISGEPNAREISGEWIATNPFPENLTVREVVLHPGLRVIGSNTFRSMRHLHRINIPSTVTKIDDSAFEDCQSLNEVTIPFSVIEIGHEAFKGCNGLAHIVTGWAPRRKRTDGLRKVVLNEGLKRIGVDAFHNCCLLKSVTIPSTVNSVTHGAFAKCFNLQDVVLKEGIKWIGMKAFRDCKKLKSITIPSTVIDIGTCAFAGCNNLREVIIHNEGVQFEDDNAFFNCQSLERFKFPSLSTRVENIIQTGWDIEAKLDSISTVRWRAGRRSSRDASRRAGELSIRPVHTRRRGATFPVVLYGDTFPVVGEYRFRGGTIYRDRFDNIYEVDTSVEVKKELNKVVRLIEYYEMKESTTLFELALWKARMDWAEIIYCSQKRCLLWLSNPANRVAYRVEVPDLVKTVILQYVGWVSKR